MKATLVFGIAGIALLLLAACAQEQIAVPIGEEPNSTATATTQTGTAASQPSAPTAAPAAAQNNGPAAPAPAPSDPQADANTAPSATTESNTTTTDAVDAGATITAQNITNIACLDSDPAEDEYVKGSVQVSLPNVTVFKTDECLGTSLREWYCDNRGDLAKEIINCQNGCTDGACNK